MITQEMVIERMAGSNPILTTKIKSYEKVSFNNFKKW